METMIEVSGLKKSFGRTQVLKGVNFRVQKGSVFALLGSNGAGKTTIIRILSTLLKPDDGYASINHFEVVEQAKQVRNQISLTGQFVAVDDILTGRENLTLIAQLKRRKDVKQKVAQWLSFANLEDAANRPVSTYSGGMRRRLDIAMSLLCDPNVLFLDEPTTGLDPQNRIAMWKLVKELAAQGTTVFLTTQYLEEAENLADHIAILHDGKILAEGSPQYLKEILPNHGIQLHFQNEHKAQQAIQVLQAHGITIDGQKQLLPSIEDVFLTLINEQTEGNFYEKRN